MLQRSMPTSKAHGFTRLRRLNGRQRRLLFRAAALLGLASAAVALLPFRLAVRFGSVPLGERENSPDDCVWAVEAASRRLPWRTVCIEKGLTVQRLLRSSGIAAVLHYGARHDPVSGELEAHVWVSAGGAFVMGGEEAANFREIAIFP